MLRQFLQHIRPRISHVSRYASRFHSAFMYGFDLVLWSRLLNRRRTAIPLDLPERLLKVKGVTKQPPVLFIADPAGHFQHWEEGFQAIYANLFLNLQMPDVISAWRYIHPAPSFKGIYLWDTAFTSQIWKHWEYQVAQEVNWAVISQQNEGRIPHVVTAFSESRHTQPPVMAWSVKCGMEWGQPADLLDSVSQHYPLLAEYNRWLYDNRRLENGLFFWEHPYESGIDNSPRFSNRDESRFQDTTQFAAPDLSSYLVLQNEALADFARILGDDVAVKKYEGQASELKCLINDNLWCETDGIYYDLDVKTGDFIRCSTIAGLIPLWAGVPGINQAERMRDTIMDLERYNTLIPFPTVGMNDQNFVKDMWCGPVWINTAFMILKGLERYGFRDELSELTFKLCEGVFQTYRNTLKFHEFYDPQRYDIEELSRKQGNRFKHITLGAKPVVDFVGWTGLVNPLIIEVLIGLNKDLKGYVLAPNLPDHTRGIEFTIRLPELSCVVSVDSLGDQRYACCYRHANGVHEVLLEAGEAWDLQSFEVQKRDILLPRNKSEL